MKRLGREPMLIFLVIGGLIFGVDYFFRQNATKSR